MPCNVGVNYADPKHYCNSESSPMNLFIDSTNVYNKLSGALDTGETEQKGTVAESMAYAVRQPEVPSELCLLSHWVSLKELSSLAGPQFSHM